MNEVVGIRISLLGFSLESQDATLLKVCWCKGIPKHHWSMRSVYWSDDTPHLSSSTCKIEESLRSWSNQWAGASTYITNYLLPMTKIEFHSNHEKATLLAKICALLEFSMLDSPCNDHYDSQLIYCHTSRVCFS